MEKIKLNVTNSDWGFVENKKMSEEAERFCWLLRERWDCLAAAVLEMKAENFERAIEILQDGWNEDLSQFPMDLDIPEELPGVDVLYGTEELRADLLVLSYIKVKELGLALKVISDLYPGISEKDLLERAMLFVWIAQNSLSEVIDRVIEQSNEVKTILDQYQ